MGEGKTLGSIEVREKVPLSLFNEGAMDKTLHVYAGEIATSFTVISPSWIFLPTC